MNSKSNKTYSHTTKALKDAFYNAGSKGKNLVFQAKKFQRSREIADRIRQLKQLVFETFCGDWVPDNHALRHDVYFGSKEKVRELGVKGGEEYDKVMAAVKMTWISPQTYKDAIESLGM